MTRLIFILLISIYAWNACAKDLLVGGERDLDACPTLAAVNRDGFRSGSLHRLFSLQPCLSDRSYQYEIVI